MQAAPPAEHKSSPVGSIIGAIIVIAVIVLGGLYFWGAQLEQQQSVDQLPFIVGDEGNANEGLPPTSSSDEVSDIETDVAATDLAAVDTALNTDLKNADAATQ